jgi:hypothetical protein
MTASLALVGQFFAMTDHDRQLQRIGEVTTARPAGFLLQKRTAATGTPVCRLKQDFRLSGNR